MVKSTVLTRVAVWMLVICLLAAGTVEASSSRDQTQSVLAFAYGLEAFNQGDFELARERFTKALSLRDDGEARFWLGLTYLELGRPDDAVTELERSLGQKGSLLSDPDTVRGFLEEARRRRPGPPGEPIRLEIPGWNRLMDVGQVRRFRARLSAAVASDSNPTLDADDASVSTGSERAGELDFLAELYPVYDREGRTVEIRLAAGESSYGESSGLDRSELGGLVQVAWGGDPRSYLSGPFGTLRTPTAQTAEGVRRHSFLLQAGALRHALDGKEEVRSLRSAFSWILRKDFRNALQFDFAFEDLDFADDLTGPLRRGGSVLELQWSALHYFPGRTRYARLALTGGRRGAGETFAAKRYGLSVESAFALTKATHLYVSASYRHDDFESRASNVYSPVGGPNRADDILRGAAGFVWAFHRHLHLTARFTVSERRSNLPFYDRRRTVTALGLTWMN